MKNIFIDTDIFNFKYSTCFSEIALDNLANGMSDQFDASAFSEILISSSFYIVFPLLLLSCFKVSLFIWTIFNKDRGGRNGKLGISLL